MKRGLISWDHGELPPADLDARLRVLHARMAEHDVPVAVVYTDVWRSNDVRYLSNFMPYWNRAFAVVPRGEKPILLCSLSPRVYPWIRSVTTHETILPSPSLPVQLVKLCGERGWSSVGIVDLMGLPNDLYTQLRAQPLAIVDLPRSTLRSAATATEVAMHRRAAQLARAALKDGLTRNSGSLTDFQLAGQLERRMRRAGAEDVVLLVSDGTTVPLPPRGVRVTEHSSVCVSVEYNGHWAKLARNLAGVVSPLAVAASDTVHLETLSGAGGWAGYRDHEIATGSVVALQVEIEQGGRRLYFGETGLTRPGGDLEIL
ncbi:MAG TPA: hypothetical protein VGM84_12250 [Steroidobacteraceae bacterium]|jgi:hypothetical protein